MQFESFSVKYQQTKNDVSFKSFNANQKRRVVQIIQHQQINNDIVIQIIQYQYQQHSVSMNSKRRVVQVIQYQQIKMLESLVTL